MTTAAPPPTDARLRTRPAGRARTLHAVPLSLSTVCLATGFPALHTGSVAAETVEAAVPPSQAAELQLMQLLRRVGDLEASLERDWGGPGSEAIDPSVAAAVRVFLQRLPWGFHPLPGFVSPTFDGGLQLEWTRGSREFEAEWRPDGVLAFLQTDEATGLELEEELDWSNAEALLRFLRWLTRG